MRKLALVVILISVIFLLGCAGEEATGNGETPPENGGETTPPTTPPSGNGGGETPVEVKDCREDLDCFKDALATCSPTTSNYFHSHNMEIKDGTPDSCTVEVDG